MDQRVEKVDREFKPLVTRVLQWWTWKRVLLAAVVVLAVLELGTYAFNWTWTGFKNNDTVWDYLQLLLLPIALAAVPVWFAAEEEQQGIWLAQLKRILVVAVVVLAVLCIGTYAYGWTWTGFHDHGKLWDWLSLLLVPVLVAVLPIWVSVRQSHRGDETSKQQ
ncbi:MAG TPA: hypothetical protein VKR83_10670 [Ktedonobacteraceae bacterium]|nr:hypothetical protein [Ktedonobacteraceae bacterium]